jgi:hypothetical protein
MEALMNRGWTWAFLALLVFALCGCQEATDPGPQPAGEALVPPLELSFGPCCGVPEGREQAYDPKTGVFHVHFAEPKPIGMRGSGLFERSAFEVTKAPGPFVRPVKFRLTGIPSNYGCVGDPLSLCVGGKDGLRDRLRLGGTCYALVEDPLELAPVDKTLFRVQHQDNVVLVEFTEKGQALLKEGTLISFQIDTGW